MKFKGSDIPARLRQNHGEVDQLERQAADRIEELERALVQQWGVFNDCFLLGTAPDQILRERAFIAFTNRLRALGLFPPLSNKLKENT